MTQLTRLQDYQPSAFRLQKTKLEFDLNESETLVKSWLHFTDISGDILLHGEHLELLEIYANDTPLKAQDYHQDGQGLTLKNITADAIIHIIVRIAPDKNTRLEGLYHSSGNLLTQCEAEGFRHITYYPDRPDVLAPFEVILRGDKGKYPTLLAGGNLMGVKDLPDNRHEVQFADPFPKPSYLFALVAGDFDCLDDSFTTAEGKSVKLHIHVDKGKGKQAEFAMEVLKNAMRWDEEIYHFCYDLEHYHIVVAHDFNMGAMENKGLNIFNSRLILASPETATDHDYDMINLVVAHEYFHNWTGNRITCRDWFQLSLKEGLTVFREQQYGADTFSALEQRIHDVTFLRARQFPEDAGPNAHPIRPEHYQEINNFYTATIYEKGAEVIRMLVHLLGEEDYYRGMEIYRSTHDGKAATCDDFIAAMQQASGKDLSQFMRWYQRAGTPHVTVTQDWQQGDLHLTLKQEIPSRRKGDNDDLPLVIPLKMGLLDRRDGTKIDLISDDENLMQGLCILTEKTQKFVLRDVPETVILSLNRGFSAPVKLLGDFAWQDLARFDDDEFNRWDAREQFFTQLLCDVLRGKCDSQEAAMQISECMKDDLHPKCNPAMWHLPDISQCAQAMDDFDPKNYYETLMQWREWIAQTHREQFLSLYQQAYENSASLYPEGRTARQIAHAALSYLIFCDENLVRQHYKNARNMTESFAALKIAQTAQKAESLQSDLMQDFLSKWQHDALVMNKWLGLMGGRIRDDNLTHIKKIIDEERYFKRTNPNNIYALLGNFTASMSPSFHHQDGSGYQFLGQFIQSMNATNPQVSARLLGMGLSNSQHLSQKRQENIKQMLQEILRLPNLASDIAEIAGNHLKAAD